MKKSAIFQSSLFLVILSCTAAYENEVSNYKAGKEFNTTSKDLVDDTVIDFSSFISSETLIDRVNHINSAELLSDTVILELEYFGWMCPCAQWISPENKTIFENRESNTSYGDSLFYDIKATSDSLIFPFDINTPYRFYGRFYKEKQWTNVEGEVEPMITLQYYKVETIEDENINEFKFK